MEPKRGANWTPDTHFWPRVDRSGGPDACWPWTGGKYREGYGKTRQNHGHGHRSHRVAYELTVGPVPEGLHVLHHCDNPPCCNPAHLWVGTPQANSKDRHQKLRDRYGEENPAHKLTWVQVQEIRVLRSSEHWTQRRLASRFGVSQQMVAKILNGRAWPAAVLVTRNDG